MKNLANNLFENLFCSLSLSQVFLSILNKSHASLSHSLHDRKKETGKGELLLNYYR